jgi:hypothetical protein
MVDPEFQNAAAGKKAPRRRRWLWRLACALIVIWGASALGIQACSRRSYTCAICRLGRVNHRCLFVTWSVDQETECSRWYRENVEPSHSHVWTKCSYCERFGIPGIWSGYACVIAGPITGLSETVQIEIYRHFENRLEAKALLARLGEGDGRQWDALMEWVGQGYPGTWYDWWKERCDSR